MSTSLVYRRRIYGSKKCHTEGQCPSITNYKSTNGTIYNGNIVIKGSELSANRQYAALVNRTSSRPIYWTRKITRFNVDIFGNSPGAPLPARLPPKNNF